MAKSCQVVQPPSLSRRVNKASASGYQGAVLEHRRGQKSRMDRSVYLSEDFRPNPGRGDAISREMEYEACPTQFLTSRAGLINCLRPLRMLSTHGLGENAVMRPPSGEEEVSPSAPKPVKNKKTKRVSTSEDPKPKKSKARKPKKDTTILPAEVVQRLRDEEEENKDDGSELVARVKRSTEAPKASESVKVGEIQPRIERISEEDPGKVPELLETEDASRRDEQSAGMSEGASSEASRKEENLPSDSLGAIEIGDSPPLPSFSEGEVWEAQAMKAPQFPTSCVDPECKQTIIIKVPEDARVFVAPVGVASYLQGLVTEEDQALMDEVGAPCLFNEAQQALNRASVLHHEAFFKSRREFSRYEAEIRGLIEEKNALKLLGEQKEQEIKGLRAELAMAQKEQSELTEQVNKVLDAYGLGLGVMANDSISQVQRLHETIVQLRGEVDEVKAETSMWKQKMDHLASEKEAARAQLSSAKIQLQGMKEKSLEQAKKIEELQARLETEIAAVKSEAETVKADAEAIATVYRSDAEAAQTRVKEVFDAAQARAYWVAEHAKAQSRRETLEDSRSWL
ncbi:PREDICTED: uncharacterized protein LOC109228073 [Nicotiana attenuata]|uniref:uncharacterized protein LOC109228073 n=1 Tax=Nicotiana attenuata TaxID=49451 RepID=UPI0009054C58|nr:PREDICTED: uncharacterized protein LOC109228073 [Nicotiana attenuata]